MNATATPRPPRGRWQQANVWAGYLIFGFPAVPALFATIARFGLLDSILPAGPALSSATTRLRAGRRLLSLPQKPGPGQPRAARRHRNPAHAALPSAAQVPSIKETTHEHH